MEGTHFKTKSLVWISELSERVEAGFICMYIEPRIAY